MCSASAMTGTCTLVRAANPAPSKGEPGRMTPLSLKPAAGHGNGGYFTSSCGRLVRTKCCDLPPRCLVSCWPRRSHRLCYRGHTYARWTPAGCASPRTHACMHVCRRHSCLRGERATAKGISCGALPLLRMPARFLGTLTSSDQLLPLSRRLLLPLHSPPPSTV